MALTSSVALLAALAMAPSSLVPDLPAICIATMGPDASVEHHRWADLLPRIVIGVDHRPQQNSRFRFDGHLPLDQPSNTDLDGADHRLESRTMTRWTVSLRWQSGPRQVSAPGAATPPPYWGLCQQLLAIGTRPPTMAIDESIDRWAEKSRLRALLRHSAHRGVRHD